MAGLAALFTRDFFALAEDRLNDDGIFVQFIHSYQMDWPIFALIGRTFADVFPNSILVLTVPSGAGGDYLLVGFKGETELFLEIAQQKLSYAQQSKNIFIADPTLLYRLIASEDLFKLFGRGPVNTDSWPRLEFAAPKLMYIKDPMIAINIRSRKWLSPQTKRIVRQITTDVDLQIDFAAYALSVYEPFRDMADLSKATPSQKERFYKLMEMYCVNNSIDYSIFKDDVLKQRCYSIQIEVIEDKIDSMPDKAISYLYLASLYYQKGILDKAIANCYKSLQIKPDNAKAHYNIGAVLVQQGKLDEAITHFTKALRVKPDFAEAHYSLGIALARQSKLDKAIRHFTKSLRIEPENAKAHLYLGVALSQQGKFDEAIRYFSEALRINPNFTAAQESLDKALLLQKSRK
jgi:Flp pilus assembly protein TadD